MNDEEIVETLAVFMSYDWKTDDGFAENNPRRYLESRDALQPVIAKLSYQQQDELTTALHGVWRKNRPQTVLFPTWLLTCPPRVLATAISEAVKGGV